MFQKIRVKEFMVNPDKFIDNAGEDYFYDWFCNDRFLTSKAKKILKEFKSIMFNDRLDVCDFAAANYMYIRNNCPIVGISYESLVIEFDKFDIIFEPHLGFDCCRGKGEIMKLDYATNNLVCLCYGAWRDIKKWFNNREYDLSSNSPLYE